MTLVMSDDISDLGSKERTLFLSEDEELPRGGWLEVQEGVCCA